MEIIPDHTFKRTLKYIRAFLFISSIGLAIILTLYISLLLYAKVLGAPPLAVPQSSIYYSDDGTVIGESHNGQKRYWMPLEDISPHVINATIAIEDQSFYSHHGFDFKRIAGAAVADLKAMAKVQGASTISQQYARNLFLEHDKTWKRKLLEAFYTMRIEMNYTKNEILEGYLNTIYYGKGAYGIEAASQYYFGKKASELNLAEAAMLAGIPKGPNIYSPSHSFEKAKERQALVLSIMEKEKFITEKEKEEALSTELTIVEKQSQSPEKIGAYFQDVVNNALKHSLEIDERTIELGGLKIYTTLNVEQQKIAEEQLSNIIPPDSAIQGGLIAMDPNTGHVKALVGGKNYDESPFNRATQALRQPGSTMKPLLYYAAVEKGFTPTSTMRSELTTFKFEDRPDYTPHNYNNLYANDDITMLQALALSDNVYAVKTHLFIGEGELIDVAEKVGITTKLEKVPSLALGTSEVRLIDMARAYSHFANGGKKIAPIFITKVEDHRGEVIFELPKPKEEEYVLKPDIAFVITHMMTGMFDPNLNDYTSVTGYTIRNEISKTYAGKSGSTDTDNWMIGFTPNLVTAVWTGYDDGRRIELPREKSYAKNIWVQFMEQALEGKEDEPFTPVKGTVGVNIDPTNGKLATKDCPISRKTYFIKGTEPTEYCVDHIFEKEETREIEKKEEIKESVPWYRKIFRWSL